MHILSIFIFSLTSIPLPAIIHLQTYTILTFSNRTCQMYITIMRTNVEASIKLSAPWVELEIMSSESTVKFTDHVDALGATHAEWYETFHFM